MRGVYINIAVSLFNFTIGIGIWNISGTESWWAHVFSSFNMFVGGYSAFNAWHCYQRHCRSQYDMTPSDYGVNWRRDGF